MRMQGDAKHVVVALAGRCQRGAYLDLNTRSDRLFAKQHFTYTI